MLRIGRIRVAGNKPLVLTSHIRIGYEVIHL